MIDLEAVIADGSSLSWLHKGQALSVSFSQNDQFIVDSSRDLIVCLYGVYSESCESPKLEVFDACGQTLTLTDELPTRRYSYLAQHPQLGVLVVTQFEEMIDGRFDWNLLIDANNRRLVRFGPAY